MLGSTASMNAVVVERLSNAADLGDFRQAQAEIVIFHKVEGAINAAHLFIERSPQQAKVKGHEFDQQPIFRVGHVATMPQLQRLPLLIYIHIVGVNHTSTGIRIENGDRFLKCRRG